jgi:hypothetical protein
MLPKMVSKNKMYTHVYIHTYICVYMYTYTYQHGQEAKMFSKEQNMYTYIYLCVYLCTYTYQHGQEAAHTHTHTHTYVPARTGSCPQTLCQRTIVFTKSAGKHVSMLHLLDIMLQGLVLAKSVCKHGCYAITNPSLLDMFAN